MDPSSWASGETAAALSSCRLLWDQAALVKPGLGIKSVCGSYHL